MAPRTWMMPDNILLKGASLGVSSKGHNNKSQWLTTASFHENPHSTEGLLGLEIVQSGSNVKDIWCLWRRRVIICGKQKGKTDRASLSSASLAHISGPAGLKTPESHWRAEQEKKDPLLLISYKPWNILFKKGDAVIKMIIWGRRGGNSSDVSWNNPQSRQCGLCSPLFLLSSFVCNLPSFLFRHRFSNSWQHLPLFSTPFQKKQTNNQMWTTTII